MNRKVLLSADWCGPCHMLKRQLADKKIEIESLKIDEDDGRELAFKYGVKTVPTLLEISDKGDLINSYYGVGDIFDILTKE